MASPPPQGRGTTLNPANRFERLHYEPDPDLPPEERLAPGTQVLRDPARSLIAYNESPDVGFDASINPYRGCEHGCVYCMSGDTRILMRDGGTRALGDLRAGDQIYGTTRDGWYRRFAWTTVRAHWESAKPAYRIHLEDGTELVASGDHRFLTERGWKFVADSGSGTRRRPYLTSGNKLMGTGQPAGPVRQDLDYKRGYLCGMVRGDGHLASYRYERAGRRHGDQHQFRLALADLEPLDRSRAYLAELGVATRTFVFAKGGPCRRPMDAIATSALASVERVRELVAWPEDPSASWSAGFLAGIFDAEGSYSEGCLRIANSDGDVIRQAALALRRFRFDHTLDGRRGERTVWYLRVRGGLPEQLRFFHSFDPAVTRKRSVAGRALKVKRGLRVLAVESLGRRLPMFDITTDTEDFIANGVVSHNCYARPFHEYLGMSAGLDFETRILVKEKAPEILRRELASRSWAPQVLAISGVTDAYQPIERQLGLTRRCLEVLAECRNPVVVVTKNHLVSRDADLLASLAAHDAAKVMVSVTTLDGDLARRLEPRASRPDRRLAAVEELHRTGVPVGVLVAPVIPALNDHEVPRILEAAAAAGASSAGYVMLRLPHAVKELFEQWLEDNAPLRRSKVLARLRDVRDGELYDARFGARMRGTGTFADQVASLFDVACKKLGLSRDRRPLSVAAFRRPAVRKNGVWQPGLFDGA